MCIEFVFELYVCITRLNEQVLMGEHFVAILVELLQANFKIVSS
jgi:hypothetical protein